MKLANVVKGLTVLAIVLFLVTVSLPTIKLTRDYVLIPRVGNDVKKTVLLLKRDLTVDTVFVDVPSNSYLKGTVLYVPANKRWKFIPVLNAQQEYALKDYCSVDSRVTRAIFLEENVEYNSSTE